MDPVFPKSELQPNGSRRVVEVVDRLSDTVVSVTHVEESHKANYRRAYLVGLVVFFCIAGMSFFSALSTTSSNKNAFRKHLADGKVSHEFRPERVSDAIGWVGAGALGLGFALSFAFFISRRKGRNSFTTESAAPGELLEGSFELLELSSGTARVRIPPTMSGRLADQQGTIEVVDLCAQGRAQKDAHGWMELDLQDGSKLCVVDGQRSYHMSWTNRANQSAVASAWKWDSRFGVYLGASAVMVMLFGLFLDSIVPDAHTMGNDAFASSRRILNMKLKPQQDPIPDEPDEGDIGGEHNDAEAEDASMAGAKGTTGIESATAAKASMAIKRRSDTPSMSKEQIRAVASHSGILGINATSQIFANINSNAVFASGESLQDMYGGINDGPAGHQIGTLSGSWGNDIDGLGHQWGTDKVGNRIPTLSYNTNGKCTNPSGCKGGPGSPKLREHKTSSTTVDIGTPKTTPGIDKAIIRRHIRRKLARIRFCYEQRLISSPNLSGTLVASFAINANGAVLGSKSSGMGDSKIQSCVAQVISSIQFPKVEDAGMVRVQYPFTFRPAGE